MTQNDGKQFPDPTFTPPEDLGDQTYELSDDQHLYVTSDPIGSPPMWRRYMLINGSWVDITPDVEE